MKLKFRHNPFILSCVRYPFCSLVHLHHVIIFASPEHVRELFEARPPGPEVVIVLVAAAGRVQRGQASSIRATSLKVKHQQGIIGGRCRVIVGSLQVLQGSARKGCFGKLLNKS